MKKYYKIKNQELWSGFKKGIIYSEDYTEDSNYNHLTVGYYAEKYPELFQEVPEIDYCLQESVVKSGKTKTITDYENDTMMDKPMTHQEAIKELKGLKKLFKVGGDAVNSVDLAIKNMEQCEVYKEPVEMEVSYNDFKFITTQRTIEGKFIGKYIDIDGISWKQARPIKPKVLSKNEWLAFKFNGTMVLAKDLNFENIDIEYTQYLNDNK
jgi:hypothetical protein